MPIETLDALARFVEAGGVVVATRQAPARPPGRSTVAARDAFATRAKALFAPRRRPRGGDLGRRRRASARAQRPRAASDSDHVQATRGCRRWNGRSVGRSASSSGGSARSRCSSSPTRRTSPGALTVGLGSPGRQVEWWNPVVGAQGDAGDRCRWQHHADAGALSVLLSRALRPARDSPTGRPRSDPRHESHDRRARAGPVAGDRRHGDMDRARRRRWRAGISATPHATSLVWRRTRRR